MRLTPASAAPSGSSAHGHFHSAPSLQQRFVREAEGRDQLLHQRPTGRVFLQFFLCHLTAPAGAAAQGGRGGVWWVAVRTDAASRAWPEGGAGRQAGIVGSKGRGGRGRAAPTAGSSGGGVASTYLPTDSDELPVLELPSACTLAKPCPADRPNTLRLEAVDAILDVVIPAGECMARLVSRVGPGQDTRPVGVDCE